MVEYAWYAFQAVFLRTMRILNYKRRAMGSCSGRKGYDMLEDIGKRAVVGTKQVLRAMQAGSIDKVYLAEDVEAFLQNKIIDAGQAYGVKIEMVPSMKTLGEACGIDVGAACVGLNKGEKPE